MIAAYQRISRADGDLGKDGKDKSNSIENQKELIQRYISCKESLQNVPVMDFVDDGYTGSNFDRPGFQQMMDGVRNGKIDTIIVKDLSRFGRDYIGVGEYMEQIFPLLGVRLIAINDNYDSNNYKGTTLRCGWRSGLWYFCITVLRGFSICWAVCYWQRRFFRTSCISRKEWKHFKC